MKQQHITMALAAVLLTACNVPAGDNSQSPPPQPTCKQDNAACSSCFYAHAPKQVDDALDQFDACYEHSHGDHASCQASNPKGADEWLALVASVCQASNCAAECCDYCSSPWGKMQGN